MKKDIKSILFERMERLNPDFKKPVELSENEQQIINDILSTNESVDNWWNKFIQYGKKGLLTAGIILAIALSSQAANSGKTDDVIKTGTKMVNNPNEINNVYNFIIGASLMLGEHFKNKMDVNHVKGANEIIYHYFKLRNNENPGTLSENAKQVEHMVNSLYNQYKNNPSKIQSIINKGKQLKKFTYTQ